MHANDKRTLPASDGQIDAAGTFASIGALLCWSVAPLFIRHLSNYFDSWTQNVYRYMFACLVLVPYLLVCKSKGQLPGRVWRKAIVPAFLNIVMQSLWALAFYYMKPGIVALIAKASVVWVFVLSIIMFKDERPVARSAVFWSGMLLSIAGVSGVILMGSDRMHGDYLTGVVIGICCSLVWAFYTVSSRKAFAGVDSVAAYCVVAVYTVFGMIAAAFIFSDPLRDLPAELWPWGCVIVSAFIGMSAGHSLFYFSMKRIGATIPTIVNLAIPFVVLAFSWFLFDERMNLGQWLFGIVLVAGAVLAITAQKRLKRS